MGKGRPHQNRWGVSIIHEKDKFVFPTSEKVAYINRVVDRANKAAGYSTEKQPSEWKYSLPGDTGAGEVIAHTRGEARSEIKKKYGFKNRLPQGTTLEKIDG